MEEMTLSPSQEKEWRLLLKVVRCFHHVESSFEADVWKRYHFGLPLPSRQTYTRSFLLASLLLKPRLTDSELEKAIRSILVQTRGTGVVTWMDDFNRVFKETGYEMFPGRTERIMELLLEGRGDNPDEWFQYFRYGVLLGKIAAWLREGGYRQLPVVPVFSAAMDAFSLKVQEPGWSDSAIVSWRDFFRLIFRFKDPESLPREESPYYYFASRAQHYLCEEAKLPERLEQYIIQTAKLKVSKLAEFKCLSILPRPACYDAKPVMPEPTKSKAKGKKVVEEEFYDEVYPAPDEDYPNAPLRYIGVGTVSDQQTVEQILALFKQSKFTARLPKAIQGDPAGDLSHAVLKAPPKKKAKAWIAKFTPHARFAMSDELKLNVRIVASVDPLPVATTIFEKDEDTGEYSIDVKEEFCNLALTVVPEQGEEIPADSTLAKNIKLILQAIQSQLGIELHESVPPENVPEG